MPALGRAAADVNNVVASALGGKARLADDRRREAVRHRAPLAGMACGAAKRRSSTFPSTSATTRWSSLRARALIPSRHRTRHRPLPPTSAAAWPTRRNPLSATRPRLRLRDLVTPVGEDGARRPQRPVRDGPAPSMIYREQGKRLIAVKFSVRGRDLAGAVAEAQEKTKDICSSRPTAPSGAASSRKCRKPRRG